MDKFQKSIHKSRRLPIIGAADRVRRPRKPTADAPLILSASELRDFLRCRVKWSWRYGSKLTTITPSVPLELGALGHNILEAWYTLPRPKRTIKAMKRIARKMLKATDPNKLNVQNLELVKAMVIGYAAWARPRDRELRINNVRPEEWFMLPLTDDKTIWVRGKIDAIFDVRSMKGTLGSFEHKFKKTIAMNSIDLNLQVSVYLWAMRKLYPKKRRYITYYNVLRKQMPGPRVKADLFAREPIERSDAEIDQWEIDTQRAVLDILDAAIYPNPMDSCGWDCDFQIPCMLRGRPDDLEHVLGSQYTTKKRN